MPHRLALYLDFPAESNNVRRDEGQFSGDYRIEIADKDGNLLDGYFRDAVKIGSSYSGATDLRQGLMSAFHPFETLAA